MSLLAVFSLPVIITRLHVGVFLLSVVLTLPVVISLIAVLSLFVVLSVVLHLFTQYSCSFVSVQCSVSACCYVID